MRASIIVTLAAGLALVACTHKETKIEQPTVVPAPAPAPNIVVVPAPTTGQVVVTYGAGGYQVAQQQAAGYCIQHYGSTGAQLVTDDRAGHATFACVQ